MLTDEQLFAAAPEAPAPEDVSDLLLELGPRAVGFTIHDESSAGWVVDRLLSYDERIARVTEQFLQLTAGIKADKARFERRFMIELEAWFDAQPKKGRSLKLLTGTLQKRNVTGGPKVMDEREVLDWATAHLPAAVLTVPATVKLDGAAVRAHCKSNGEVVPGVEWTPDRETFSVAGPKPAKED